MTHFKLLVSSILPLSQHPFLQSVLHGRKVQDPSCERICLLALRLSQHW